MMTTSYHNNNSQQQQQQQNEFPVKKLNEFFCYVIDKLCLNEPSCVVTAYHFRVINDQEQSMLLYLYSSSRSRSNRGITDDDIQNRDDLCRFKIVRCDIKNKTICPLQDIRVIKNYVFRRKTLQGYGDDRDITANSDKDDVFFSTLNKSIDNKIAKMKQKHDTTRKPNDTFETEVDIRYKLYVEDFLKYYINDVLYLSNEYADSFEYIFNHSSQNGIRSSSSSDNVRRFIPFARLFEDSTRHDYCKNDSASAKKESASEYPMSQTSWWLKFTSKYYRRSSGSVKSKRFRARFCVHTGSIIMYCGFCALPCTFEMKSINSIISVSDKK